MLFTGNTGNQVKFLSVATVWWRLVSKPGVPGDFSVIPVPLKPWKTGIANLRINGRIA